MSTEQPPRPNGKQPFIRRVTRKIREEIVVEEHLPVGELEQLEHGGDELPESEPLPPEPDSTTPAAPRRRQEDINAAIAVTAGVDVPSLDRRADVRSGLVASGRRSSDRASEVASKAQLQTDFIEARDFWARRLGRPPRNLEQNLKQWIREFGLGQLLQTFERVRSDKPGGAIAERYDHLLHLLRKLRDERGGGRPGGAAE